MSEDRPRRVVEEPNKLRSLSWPDIIEDKLDTLTSLANQSGDRTSRREVVAALIALADMDGEVMSDLLHQYRRLTVDEILTAGNEV